MRQESDGVRLYAAETTFTWWRKAFMHVETSQDGVERSWWTSSNSAQLFCETSITASRDTILTCRDVHKIALSHQVKVVKANYTNALRLTPAPYVVLCAFENIMGLPVKTNLAAVTLKGDLATFRTFRQVFDVFGGQNFISEQNPWGESISFGKSFP